MGRRASIVLTLLLGACGGPEAATAPPTDDTAGAEEPAGGALGLPAEFHVGDELVLSARPSPEQLRTLRERGITTVVRLHGPSPADDDAASREIVEEMGLDYVSVRFDDPAALSADQLQALSDAVACYQGPTLVYCASGDLSASVHATLYFLAGATVDEAIARYDATGQTASHDALLARLRALCEQRLGGCAAPGEDPGPPADDPDVEGHPGLLPPR